MGCTSSAQSKQPLQATKEAGPQVVPQQSYSPDADVEKANTGDSPDVVLQPTLLANIEFQADVTNSLRISDGPLVTITSKGNVAPASSELDSQTLAAIRWGHAIGRVVANGGQLGKDAAEEEPVEIEVNEARTTSSKSSKTVKSTGSRRKVKKKTRDMATVSHGLVLQQRNILRKPLEMKARKKACEFTCKGKKNSFGQHTGDPSRWSFDERDGYQIRVSAQNLVDPIEVATKEEAVAMVKATPHKYFGCEWVQEGYEGGAKVYKITTRVFHTGFGPFEDQPDALGAMVTRYRALEPDVPVPADRRHKEDMLLKYGNHQLELRQPGRGQNVADMPGLKIVGDVDPSDLFQGTVGDCWLLSAISSLAEFDGAILRMFRNNACLDSYPTDEFNTYTVTLYDLSTFEPVNVVVDETLTYDTQAGNLLGCRPSVDGELWGCYIEKAVAIHCGGWEAINGGICTHAWQILTGTREVYTIKRKGESSGFRAYGCFNPNTESWEEQCNSPHKSFSALWPMKWPEVGGGGDINQEFDQEELFMKMCAWDDTNYVVCAGTKPGSDQVTTSGLADGHCYTVISVLNDAGGTEFDMLQMRNPWGRGEYDAGDWCDGGVNWTKYPEVFKACGCPQDRDDGIFWMEKHDFFKHFVVIYVCAVDMSQFGCDQEMQPVKSQAPEKPRKSNRRKAGSGKSPRKQRSRVLT